MRYRNQAAQKLQLGLDRVGAGTQKKGDDLSTIAPKSFRLKAEATRVSLKNREQRIASHEPRAARLR
jgi:hypothetical protein